MKKTRSSTIKEAYMLYHPEQEKWVQHTPHSATKIQLIDNPCDATSFFSIYVAENFIDQNFWKNLQIKKMRIKQVTIVEEISDDY